MRILLEIVGWSGAVMVLAAYALLSSRRLDGTGLPYHLMNLSGAVALAIYGIWKEASASVMVNVIWAFIGIAAIASILRRRQS